MDDLTALLELCRTRARHYQSFELEAQLQASCSWGRGAAPDVSRGTWPWSMGAQLLAWHRFESLLFARCPTAAACKLDCLACPAARRATARCRCGVR